MKKNIAGLGAAALAAGLLLSGCGAAGGMSNTADKKPLTNQPATVAANQPAKAAATQPAVAKVGSTITLKGSDEGEQAAVTLKKIVDPATASNEYSKPKTGNRFVAIQLQIQNTGTITYSDYPSGSAKVTDADGQQFDSTYGDVTAGPGFAGSVSLMPGKKALGYIVFEVPKASKAATVQFGMSMGFGAKGEWEAK